jgi:PEP-CTERM motif-containing protein
MLSRKTQLALVAAASIFVSVAAQAVPVFTLSSATGVWQNVVPQSGLTEIEYQTVLGESQVRFGQDAKAISAKSGYGFKGAAPPSMPFTLGSDFLLGTFTHYNLPISPNSSITSAELLVSFSITVDAQVVADVVLASFLHNETNNTCNPKPSCTDDHVTLAATSGITMFTYGGFEYTLDITGFSTNGGATTLETFDTKEGLKNSAGLYANLTARQISTVPEPGTLGLFGVALLAIGLVKRRRTA